MRALRVVRTALGTEARAIAAAALLLLLAVAIPPLDLPRGTYTYIVFLDITQSMGVEDYQHEGRAISRLAYARLAVRRALRDLPCGSRIGLGAFTEYRTLLLLQPIEVCTNYGDLIAALDNVDGGMRWSNSSEIAKGVFWAVRAAKEVGHDAQVLFLTDGQEAPPLRPAMRPNFEDVQSGQVRGWLIGVGGYAPQPIPKFDAAGNFAGYWQPEDMVQPGQSPLAYAAAREHLSGVREAHLQTLAARVGFEYAHLTQLSSVSQAMRDARFMQRRPAATNVAWLPAASALILLALRFAPPLSRMRFRLRRSAASQP